MRKLIVNWTSVLTLVVICGCQTASISVQNQNKILGEIRNAIAGISGEPRAVSENNREIISQYFSRSPDGEFDPQIASERL